MGDVPPHVDVQRRHCARRRTKSSVTIGLRGLVPSGCARVAPRRWKLAVFSIADDTSRPGDMSTGGVSSSSSSEPEITTALRSTVGLPRPPRSLPLALPNDRFMTSVLTPGDPIMRPWSPRVVRCRGAARTSGGLLRPPRAEAAEIVMAPPKSGFCVVGPVQRSNGENVGANKT